MDVLLAQVTNSGNWSDPVAWGELAKTIGAGGIFLAFFTIVGAVFVWRFGGIVIDRLFGENGVIERGYNALSSFLDATKANQEKISALFSTHVGNCEKIHEPMGSCNVKDMRLAGHSAAEALRELARGTPNEKTVAEHADDMHAILRGEKP